jgi:hypothetical protein
MLARGIGILALIALGAGLAPLTGCGPGEAGDFSKVDFTPAETRTGPVGDEFNSDDFAIVRVLRQPKQLSAFGYASLYDDTREVGRMDEGQKALSPETRGERIVFSWQYTGTPGAAATARVLLYRQRDDEPIVLEEQYTNLERGRHRIAYNNRGAQFRDKGAVNRWQIQVISAGKVVAQKQSNLWTAAAGGQPAADQ